MLNSSFIWKVGKAVPTKPACYCRAWWECGPEEVEGSCKLWEKPCWKILPCKVTALLVRHLCRYASNHLSPALLYK